MQKLFADHHTTNRHSQFISSFWLSCSLCYGDSTTITSVNSRTFFHHPNSREIGYLSNYLRFGHEIFFSSCRYPAHSFIPAIQMQNNVVAVLRGIRLFSWFKRAHDPPLPIHHNNATLYIMWFTFAFL